ncbi:MAG: hypothetical protein J0G30_08680 [Actinomycetales bacterium]|nr:hypothetical protein [Actinomycetales bacterium]
MRRLPRSPQPLLVRTEFASPGHWDSLRLALATPDARGHRSEAHIVDDGAFRDLAPNQLLRRLAGPTPLLLVADSAALYREGHPVRVVDPSGAHAAFRCLAAEIAGLEGRLPLQDRDWAAFAAALGTDGVYRGAIVAA